MCKKTAPLPKPAGSILRNAENAGLFVGSMPDSRLQILPSISHLAIYTHTHSRANNSMSGMDEIPDLIPCGRRDFPIFHTYKIHAQNAKLSMFAELRQRWCIWTHSAKAAAAASNARESYNTLHRWPSELEPSLIIYCLSDNIETWAQCKRTHTHSLDIRWR